MYSANDIVIFAGDIYEVERIEDDTVVIYDHNGMLLHIKFDRVKLVCKAVNRQDLIH